MRSTLLSILIVLMWFGGRTHEVVAPDRKMTALIENFCPEGNIKESRITFVDASGRVLAQKSYVSKDSEHGYGIIHAQWTSDSQFFVYCMASSGGHQAWHMPTWIYSAHGNRIFSIDEMFGPVASRSFQILSGDSLQTTILRGNINSIETVVIPLSGLIHRPK